VGDRADYRSSYDNARINLRSLRVKAAGLTG